MERVACAFTIAYTCPQGRPLYKTDWIRPRFTCFVCARTLCLSEIKHAHTDDGVRQEMAQAQCDQRRVLFAASGRPCWISSVNAQGQTNLAPYSFFNAFLYDPPILGFSSISWKDTVKNASETKEFVWNLVTKELATG